MKILEILYGIVTAPIYLVAVVFELIKEYWWAVLIVVVLLWPKLSDRAVKEEGAAQTWMTGAVQQVEYTDDPALTMDNTGVCKNLSENAHVIVLFLNDDESTWSAQDMNDYLLDAVEPALTYLNTAAAEYGIALALDYSYYVDAEGQPTSINYSGIVTTGSAEYINDDILEQSASELGFTSRWDMLDQDQLDSGVEQIAYLVCINKNGRSFANCVMGAEGTEYMMMYNQIPDKWSRRNGVVHEFLHMFGAEDMYAENGRNVNREKLAKQLHRYDVMLEARWHFEGNTIGPFTAYSIGWLDALPEEYNCPEWWS